MTCRREGPATQLTGKEGETGDSSALYRVRIRIFYVADYVWRHVAVYFLDQCWLHRRHFLVVDESLGAFIVAFPCVVVVNPLVRRLVWLVVDQGDSH